MKINSIKFKLTTLYTAILGAILILYVFYLSRHYGWWVIVISLPIVLILAGFIGQLLAVKLLTPLKEVAEFSSYAAHELKTSLAIIRGESELALRKERPVGEYQRVIKANLAETERMVKTIDDMLLLSKLDYRPELFEAEEFDLIPFLKEIYEQSKILASQRDVRVSIDLPDKPIMIKANKLHLRRLFFNLIHNAVKFNSTNGRIDITVKAEDEKAVVCIRDTGIGIAEKDLPRIFDKFFHIERTDQKIESGSGLGLAIAQSIARIHQGRIEVQSRPGEGSTFKLVLPLA